jgi:hypothetical protein
MISENEKKGSVPAGNKRNNKIQAVNTCHNNIKKISFEAEQKL